MLLALLKSSKNYICMRQINIYIYKYFILKSGLYYENIIGMWQKKKFAHVLYMYMHAYIYIYV